MKIIKKSLAMLCGVLLSVGHVQAATLSQWTFEASLPNLSAGAGVWITNLVAEGGVSPGVASSLHATAAVYSNPAGNISAESFSATAWSVGDFFQFNTSTLGYSGVSISYDQTGSGTGPRDFSLSYSTDGTTFIPFGSTYAVLLNGGTPNASWGTLTGGSAYNVSFDLTAVTALDDTATIWFRVIDASTTSIGGGTVATGGTDRIDNFTITATAIPEPTTFALVGVGAFALMAYRRRG